jgi:hypothetical protein
MTPHCAVSWALVLIAWTVAVALVCSLAILLYEWWKDNNR